MTDDPVVVEIEVRAPVAAVYAMFTDPGELVRWIGIRALLEPRGDVTRLRLTHRGLPDAMRPWHADGWRRFLARLCAVAEGRDPGPDPAAEGRPDLERPPGAVP
jgi:hypothetical protein